MQVTIVEMLSNALATFEPGSTGGPGEDSAGHVV